MVHLGRTAGKGRLRRRDVGCGHMDAMAIPLPSVSLASTIPRLPGLKTRKPGLNRGLLVP